MRCDEYVCEINMDDDELLILDNGDKVERDVEKAPT